MIFLALGFAIACGGQEVHGPGPSRGGAGGASDSGGLGDASSAGGAAGGGSAAGASAGGASQDPDVHDASLDTSSGGRVDEGGARSPDAAVADGAPAEDAPSDAATTDLDCRVAHRVDGVLTNLVGARFRKASGVLDIDSVCFRQLSSASFPVIAEVVNRSPSTQCDPSVTATIDGRNIVLAVVQERTYHVPGMPIDTMTSCIPPGEKAVAVGVFPAAGLPEFAVHGPVAVEYSVTSGPATARVPHPGTSTLGKLDARLVSGSYLVSGTLEAGGLRLSDIRAWILFRDASGLVRQVYFSPGPVALQPHQEHAFSLPTTETAPFAELRGWAAFSVWAPQ